MPQQPIGDPDFTIDVPTNGSVLGPNFSVSGPGPQNMTNLVASVGTTTQTGTQQPNSTSWEAVFSNMASGTYAVSATSSAGTAPVPPTTITVTVNTDPGVTIGWPTPPAPMAAAPDPQGNPWDGWKIAGTYDPTKVTEVWVYLTQCGANVNLGAGEKAWGKATLDSNGKSWSCGLNFVPMGYRGVGFLIHYNAHLVDNKTIVHGSLPSFFNGPPAAG